MTAPRARKPTERRLLTSDAIADFNAPEPAAPTMRKYDVQRERRAAIVAHVQAQPGIDRASLRVLMGGMSGQDLGTYLTGHIRRGEIAEANGGLTLTKAPAKSAPTVKPIVHLRLADARTPGAVTRRHNCAHLTACEDEWMRHKGGAMAYCPGKCEHEAPVAARDRYGGGSGRSTWMEGA